MATRLDTAELKKRSDTAWRLRDMWKSILRDAYELAFAGINPYLEDNKNPRPMNKQYDSTASFSVMKLANRLLNDLTPPGGNWISVELGPLVKMQATQEQMEDAAKMLGAVTEIGNMVVSTGSAIAARGEAFMDVVIAGMGCILCLPDHMDDNEPIIDIAVSQSEVAIEQDEKGHVSGVYRKRKIKVRELKSLWGDAIMPENLPPPKKDKDPEIDVLEVTYKAPSGNAKPWHYEVLYCGSNSDPVRIVERSYDNNPWTIFRWSTLPGMPYGPGPVLLALPDIRTGAKVMEMMLQSASIALAGMYLVRDDGVINQDNIVISPGALIPVASTGGSIGASMVPLGTSREFDLGQFILKEMQDSIRKHLYDTTLPPLSGSAHSATEIVQRIREDARDIGGALGRLSADVVQYARVRLEMLTQRGMLPPMKIDQFTLKVSINSPLARSQHLAEVENVIQWMQMTVSIGGPQMTMMIANIEKIIEWISKKLGIQPELLRSREERAQLEQNVANIMAAQQQASGQLPVQAV